MALRARAVGRLPGGPHRLLGSLSSLGSVCLSLCVCVCVCVCLCSDCFVVRSAPGWEILGVAVYHHSEWCAVDSTNRKSCHLE